MRLFIAIEPDDEVKCYLENLQKKIFSPDAKLTFSKGYHLTLKFLGDVSEVTSGEIQSELEKIKFERFRIETTQIGFFPDEKAPRVIWIGVEPKEKIIRLQKDIDNAMERIGFLKDNRFHPHITLARGKYIDTNCIDEIRQLKTKKETFDVDSFILYKSDLHQTGPKYTKIFEKKLN
jgi:RNA 2',3'-cyclic 3'-phosphodiesterase